MIWSVLLLIRFLIASVLILFLPGFALHLALFPHAEFDRAERAFLVLSTSVALSSLAAVALAWTPAGVQAWSFALLILAITMLLGIGAVVRRGGRHAYRATLHEAAQTVVGLRRSMFSSWNRLELPLFLLVLMVLVGAAMLRGESSTTVTEFYFPPEQLSALVTRSQDLQSPVEVPFEIANNAAQGESFRVEAWSDGAKLSEQATISVGARSAKQMTIEVPATNSESGMVELRLYNSLQAEPVAQLRLQRGTTPSDNTAQQ